MRVNKNKLNRSWLDRNLLTGTGRSPTSASGPERSFASFRFWPLSGGDDGRESAASYKSIVSKAFKQAGYAKARC